MPDTWLLVPLVLLVGGSMAVFAMLAFLLTVLASTTAPLIVGVAAVGLIHAKRRRHATLLRAASAGTAPLGRRAPAPSRPAPPAWAQAHARFDVLRQEYAAYECDPMQVLRRPALSDVSVPSTGRFVEAFAEAQAWETAEQPPPAHAASFVAAVDRAERAWQAARDAAERIRLSGLTPAERKGVERAIKLLTTARDSDSDAERLTAYALARGELAKLERAGVVQMPMTAQAALDAAGRGQLPA